MSLMEVAGEKLRKPNPFCLPDHDHRCFLRFRLQKPVDTADRVTSILGSAVPSRCPHGDCIDDAGECGSRI
jgi:histone acetyltransferase (RNA polymerase elongator complex component)